MALSEKKLDNIADFVSAWKQWDPRWDFSYKHGGAFSNRFSDAGYPSIEMYLPAGRREQIRAWLNKHFGNNYYICDYGFFTEPVTGSVMPKCKIFFNTEQDKVFFILRWS